MTYTSESSLLSMETVDFTLLQVFISHQVEKYEESEATSSDELEGRTEFSVDDGKGAGAKSSEDAFKASVEENGRPSVEENSATTSVVLVRDRAPHWARRLDTTIARNI